MTAGEILAAVDAADRRGEFLLAFDLACRGLTEQPGDRWLQHRSVLALARSGALAEAIDRFQRLGLSGAAETDIAALEGRLLKDLALRAEGPERRRLAARSAAVYERLFRAGGAAYPGVNAATMALLAGEAQRARGLAEEVLARLPADDGSFWVAASRAEAALVLDDRAAAAIALAEAASREPANHAARAVARRQLHLVCGLTGADPALTAPLAASKVAHFTGHMMRADEVPNAQSRPVEAQAASAIAAALAAEDVGFGYGSLACGADILFAEALLARGAELDVVLPHPPADFLAGSVEIGGASWPARFQRCLDAATSVTVTAPGRFAGDDLDYRVASHQAMGMALLRARHLDAEAVQLAMWDGAPPAGPAGAARDVNDWRRAGGRTLALPCPWREGGQSVPPAAAGPRRPVAVLFGDFTGFSRLTEPQYLRFFEGIVPALAEVLAGAGPALLYRNSWGDGLKLVFAEAAPAVACGLALQAALARLCLPALGLPADLALRLSGDYGPALEVYDAVRGTRKFAGSVLTRAARIEPVTPPGRLFLTAAMAARLLIEAQPDGPGCDYVGQIGTAKGYGLQPLYAARAS